MSVARKSDLVSPERTASVVKWLIAGVLFLGSLLGALRNAAALDLHVAILGFCITLLFWLVLEYTLPRVRPTWHFSGTPQKITGLGLQSRCFFFGILLVFCVSLAYNYSSRETRRTSNPAPTMNASTPPTGDGRLSAEQQSSFDRLLNQGIAHRNARQYLLAIHDYNEALRIDPKSADAYDYRGFSKSKLGHCDEALPDFTTSIQLKPTPSAYYNRGVCFMRLRDWSSADADLTHAIELNPELAGAYLSRATVRERQGNMAGKREDLQRVKELGLTSHPKEPTQKRSDMH